MDVGQLLGALRSSGASWQADSTALTALSADPRRLRLGYVPGPDAPSLDQREQVARARYEAFRAGALGHNIGTPASFDLWRVDGQNDITSIKVQGNCGSVRRVWYDRNRSGSTPERAMLWAIQARQADLSEADLR